MQHYAHYSIKCILSYLILLPIKWPSLQCIRRVRFHSTKRIDLTEIWSKFLGSFQINRQSIAARFKMKIFQSTKKFLESVGITAESRPLNMRNLIVLVVFAIMMILIWGFLFFRASNFKEYTESIYMSSVTLAIFSTFTFVIWKKSNVFQFIDCWERIAATSKFKL